MIRKIKIAAILTVMLLFSSNIVHAQQVASPAYSVPFMPGSTTAISVSNSASIAQTFGATFSGSNTLQQVMISNSGANTCFVAFGSSSVVATTSSTPVLSGAIEIFTVNQYTQYVSAITASSTTTCYFTIGIGQ